MTTGIDHQSAKRATQGEAGLVRSPGPLTGLTEIRVHGVGGTGPIELLGDLSPRRVAGDNTAGFYRTSDAAGRHREAYSWGGLTSHSRFRVLWMLLLPSMLANMAGWTVRQEVSTSKSQVEQEPSTRFFRWSARLAALGLTLNVALIITMLSVDLLFYQCLGQQLCVDRLWGGNALHIIAPFERPGQRLAWGIALPVAVALLLYFLAYRSRTKYEGYEHEHIEPRDAGLPLPAPVVRCAAAQKGGLTNSNFWFGWMWHKHLSRLHLAAVFALLSGTLGWCLLELGNNVELPTMGVLVARSSLYASALIILVVIGLLVPDDAKLGLSAALGWVASLVMTVTAATAWVFSPLGGGAESAVQPVGVAPGIVTSTDWGWVLILVLLIPLVIQQLLAWCSRWIHALRFTKLGSGYLSEVKSAARGSIKVFPWSAPIVLNVVALFLSSAGLLSLTMLVSRSLATVQYGMGELQSEQSAVGDGKPVLWVPERVVLVTSFLTLGLLALLVLFGLGAAVFLFIRAKFSLQGVTDDLQTEYKQSNSGLGSAPWTMSTLDSGMTRRPDGSKTSRWIFNVALMRQVGSYSRSLVAFLMIMITSAGLILILVFYLPGPRSWLSQQDFSSSFLLDIGTTTIGAWLPIIYIAAAQFAFRHPRIRKALMTPFDVGTFFPRSFHPFSPPSYAERAVPELTRRILYIHHHGGKVVLTAHSQGSVIAAATLARKSAQQVKPELGLLTFGSPLGKLYRWAFPSLITNNLLQNLAAGAREGVAEVRWWNVYYATDYVGGEVQLPEWPASMDVDICLADPATDKFVFGQPQPPILSHTGYWGDKRLWKKVDSMCERIETGASTEVSIEQFPEEEEAMAPVAKNPQTPPLYW